MDNLRILFCFVLMALSTSLQAERFVVESEGTALKTAELPYSVYEARAISNALQLVLQTGAQSLDSFSLVENGKVLFDQISAQSNVQIAGYRVLSTKDHGDKVSARLEILLLPENQNETQISCRQPNNLDLAFKWQGLSIKKSLPFWVQFDELSLTQTIEAMMAANPKFNFQENNSDRSSTSSSYSLYESGNTPKRSIPNYLLTLSLDLDAKTTHVIQRKKVLVVKAKSELFRKSKALNGTETKTEMEIEKSGMFVGGSNSRRRDLESIQEAVFELAVGSITQTLHHLECMNFSGKIKLKNENLEIDYGLQDGLSPDDIFSSIQSGTQQYYFTVKQMNNTSTTLHALTQGKTGKYFDGLSIKLLERY
ncbi:hypothetical protein N8Z94_05285 [Planktomarina temperata]|jgi:hypothetical protein|nr:hypothetical protein [bacterium]MDA8860377.1 hypothetical protein [Planktomarina temperata]MDB2460358.1 hypothetical protein [Planktomarina temperata]MDC1271998.1 hypothetical protein [Planktomarina temperata]